MFLPSALKVNVILSSLFQLHDFICFFFFKFETSRPEIPRTHIWAENSVVIFKIAIYDLILILIKKQKKS